MILIISNTHDTQDTYDTYDTHDTHDTHDTVLTILSNHVTTPEEKKSLWGDCD